MGAIFHEDWFSAPSLSHRLCRFPQAGVWVSVTSAVTVRVMHTDPRKGRKHHIANYGGTRMNSRDGFSHFLDEAGGYGEIAIPFSSRGS